MSEALQMNEWSYGGECGPQTWSKDFPSALGHYQSPVNIDTSKVKYEKHLHQKPLRINYVTNCCARITNTGHSFQVDSNLLNNSTVRHGPVDDEYRFLQFHLHWGNTIERGSEHLIDNEPYSAELHFVNWNHDLYKNSKEASQANEHNGLLVMAVFVKIGEFNPEFEKLSKCLHAIHLKEENVSVDHLDIMQLLPENIHDYYTYPGSLTTPPCSESVTWVVFKQPIEITEEQLQLCHQLYSVSKENEADENHLIKYNDRPVCSLDHRKVFKSFH